MASSQRVADDMPALQRARRAIVVVDVVESVRLMQADEAGVIDRWRRFVNEVRTEVLPAHGGRLVKSLGDGMLLEFEEVAQAVAAAFDAQLRIGAYNHATANEEAIALRVGVHVADIVVDDLDVYGAGVNLAARLAGLAGLGEIVASPEVRDQLVVDLDADIEDLGECYVKHYDRAIRAFRIAPLRSGLAPALKSPSTAAAHLRPTIIVLPPVARAASAQDEWIGDVVADDVITALSRSAHWQVISRLSSSTPRLQTMRPGELRALCNASYVLSGHYRSLAGRLRLSLELADTRDDHVVWADVLQCDIGDLFAGDPQMLAHIVAEVSAAVLSTELVRAGGLALPSLEGYAVLMQGVSLMHRMSRAESDRAASALQHLVDRHPRAPEPRAWLGKWYVMRVAQAWTVDPQVEAGHARAAVARALDMVPTHALSLAIDGLVYAMVDRNLVAAQERYQQALDANPNEAHAWLFMSSVHAHRGDGAEARRCMSHARANSPLDPLDYFFDVFDAWAALADGAYGDAERLALRSFRLNRHHVPTYTVLAAAHALAGHGDDARVAGQRLLTLRPDFSVDRFVSLFPGGPSAHARLLGDALRAAALPQ